MVLRPELGMYRSGWRGGLGFGCGLVRACVRSDPFLRRAGSSRSTTNRISNSNQITVPAAAHPSVGRAVWSAKTRGGRLKR